jgi:hypothetical protein
MAYALAEADRRDMLSSIEVLRVRVPRPFAGLPEQRVRHAS